MASKRHGHWSLRRVFQFRSMRDNLGVEVDAEVRDHLRRTRDRLVRDGLNAEEALAEARRRFGDVERYSREMVALDRQRGRRIRGVAALETVGDVARQALRSLWSEPSVTFTVVATIALGVAANATMFGVIDRLLLQPPAHIANPDEVVRIYVERQFINRTIVGPTVSYPDYADFADLEGAVEVAAVSNVPAGGSATVGHGDAAFRIALQRATPSLFPLLGVEPLLGRFPRPEEDAPGAADILVLGYEFWRSAYAGDPDAVGRSIQVNGVNHEIIGVAPRDFTGVDLQRIDAWSPLHGGGGAAGWHERRGWMWLRAIARLDAGASLADVEARATVLHRLGHEAETAYDKEARVLLSSLIAARGLGRSNEARVATWLAAVAALVLLIACANVANILLARGMSRQNELGIRLALGISRRRLLAMQLAESLMLALLGGVAALVIARWGSALVRGVLLPNVHWGDTVLNGRLFGFTLGAAAFAGFACALLPAMGALRSDVVAALGGSSSRGLAGVGGRWRSGLLLLQTTLAALLLVIAGLFVRSLLDVQATDFGFDQRDLVVLIPDFEDEAITPEETAAFFEQTAATLRRLPAVLAATASSSIPFYSSYGAELVVPDVPEPPTFTQGGPYLNYVDADYFAAMGVDILRGRGFLSDENTGSPLSVVVEERMANAYFPDGSALGRCLKIGGDEAPCSTIVGIAESTARQSIDQGDEGQYYALLAQHQTVPTAIFVRLNDEPTSAALELLQREVSSRSEAVRYTSARPLARFMDWQTRSWELGAFMFTIFGLLALVIAAVGLYAVMAFSVARRTREIGVRAALGAAPARLVWMVVGRALALVAASVAVGVSVAAVAGPWLAPLLHGVGPNDPLVLGAVVMTLVTVGGFAALVPGVRAARVDAAVALRAD